MRIDVLTLFPDMFPPVIGASIPGRAAAAGLLEFHAHDIRAWTVDKHRKVDDRPFGGGPGMVMKIEPIDRALNDLRTPESRVILMSPQGRKFSQAAADGLAREKHLILVCGHYEGIDQRVADHLVDDEISIGDYVLTSGVLPALVVTDAVVRLIPGVLGDSQSAVRESFVSGLLDHPHDTRPETYRGWQVPGVLLSGNHAAIEAWRSETARETTRCRRPDLPV